MDYYVDPRVRLDHEASIRRMQWSAVNTMSPNYPDLCAINHKYPHLSVSEAMALIAKNKPLPTNSNTGDTGEDDG